ncbi:ATP-binding protein [Psittacicella melopsittaci]|uniref:ATP-binding protein n=1 Tax=Psittacicella melopsittaci TaxID=2028576 RepID=UPI001CA62B27|nr:ATP-binding protein [Psittacicella melopsittaci]
MESHKIEYKIDIPAKENNLKAEIVSFLNTEGGEIHLGVDDNGIIDHEIISKKKKIWEEKLTNWIREAFSPNVSSLIKIYPEAIPFKIIIQEGKFKPYYYKNNSGMNLQGVYIRVGSSKRIASDDEILRMLFSSPRYIYEENIIDRKDLTFTYLEEEFKKKNVKFDKYGLNLLNRNDEYNNAALLLRDQNPIVTKFAKFEGTTVTKFLDKKEFKGSILRQLDEVLYFSHLSNSNLNGEEELLKIPTRALREAIVNCFCHRDYSLESSIKIELYDDRIRIVSPGCLPDGLSLEEIKNGKSSTRNKIIVDTLNKIDRVENDATGVRRIFEDYSNYEKQPVYEITKNAVIVTLYSINNSSDSKNINRKE